MALNVEQVRQTADRVAVSHGLDIVAVDFLGTGKQRILRIFIEKNAENRARLAEEAKDGLGESAVERGIALDQLAWVTHEDCEHFSRDFGTVLDVEDLVPGSDYTLEVSSPGLDRKLTTRAEFERFKGSPISVKMNSPVAGNRNFQGKLTEVKADGIVIDPEGVKQKGRKRATGTVQTMEIAFSNIEKAHLIPWIG